MVLGRLICRGATTADDRRAPDRGAHPRRADPPMGREHHTGPPAGHRSIRDSGLHGPTESPSMSTTTGERSTQILSEADRLARTFADRAAEHDREATFPYDNYADLADAGIL